MATTSGVNVGVAGSVALKSFSNSQSVYIMAMATKLGGAPLGLPDKVPGLTDEAIAVLKGPNGEEAFHQKYGTHFILGGWRLTAAACFDQYCCSRRAGMPAAALCHAQKDSWLSWSKAHAPTITQASAWAAL